MISTNQFKNGSHIEVDGQVFRILEFQHVKPGKGGAFVRTRLKNVSNGAVLDKTFRAGEKFRAVRTESRKMQYLYDQGDEAVLMDLNDYDQMALSRSVVGDSLDLMVPNDEVIVLFVDEQPSDIQLPTAVELTVAKTQPGLRGDTASGGGTKPATLESGVTVQVPLFVNEGDRVKIDTRTREYLARA
jgi:elongation factor P